MASPSDAAESARARRTSFTGETSNSSEDDEAKRGFRRSGAGVGRPGASGLEPLPALAGEVALVGLVVLVGEVVRTAMGAVEVSGAAVVDVVVVVVVGVVVGRVADLGE